MNANFQMFNRSSDVINYINMNNVMNEWEINHAVVRSLNLNFCIDGPLVVCVCWVKYIEYVLIEWNKKGASSECEIRFVGANENPNIYQIWALQNINTYIRDFRTLYDIFYADRVLLWRATSYGVKSWYIIVYFSFSRKSNKRRERKKEFCIRTFTIALGKLLK